MSGFAAAAAWGGAVVAGLVSRKANAFAALVDGNAPAATDPHLAQLANIASRLGAMPQPTAAFRSALRDQLMATAGQSATAAAPHAAATHTATTHAPAAHPAPTHAPSLPTPRLGAGHAFGHGLATLGKSAPVWAKVFAGVAAVSVSATGVAVGADRALPGDFFYGVKKQVEAVQLDLASGAHSKALTELGFAQARINELHKLIQRDHVVAGQPVSKETAAHIKGLLENWAENAGVATTSLIQQIQALGSSQSTAAQSAALRAQLSAFTSKQFGELGTLLGAMPSAALQSLTVSALGYLQRVDAVLGHDPASLIGKLPLSLNSVPGVSKVLPRLVLPSTIPTTGGSVVLPSPSVLTSLVPKAGGLLASLAPGSLPNGTGIALPSSGTKISLPPVVGALPSLVPQLGSVPGAVSSLAGGLQNGGSAVVSQVPGAAQSVGGAIKNVGGAVTGQLPAPVQSAAGAVTSGVAGAITSTLGAITGGVSSSAGPSLPLPISLPVLPSLPKLPGLH